MSEGRYEQRAKISHTATWVPQCSVEHVPSLLRNKREGGFGVLLEDTSAKMRFIPGLDIHKDIVSILSVDCFDSARIVTSTT